MTKPTANPLPALVQNFFTQHLMTERQLSPCTVASYRDTFRLLLGYFQAQTHRSASQQRLEDWDAPHILGFLEHLEKQRHCCARSRNARLAAIHCFMRFVSQQEPKHLALAGRVLAIPNKRHLRPLLGYLTAEQVQAILQAPAPDTFSGRRDRLLFQLLYNTGARVSEIVALNRQDLLPNTCQTVTLHGKGRKERTVPLWPKTARQMRQWLDPLPPEPSTPVFANRSGGLPVRHRKTAGRGRAKSLAGLPLVARTPGVPSRLAPHYRHASASGGRGHHSHRAVARTRKPPDHSPIHRSGP